MIPAAIIAKKRDGDELLASEIDAMVRGFLDGQVADCQMSAWAMAVLLRGMSMQETATLTGAMLRSGTSLPRTSDRPRIDKHSTGGLGDSTSLVLAPLLACFELDVPMLSGRALGITGGTLDKLESIPGYRCNLDAEAIGRQLQAIGCVITGTTPDIAPADRKLYALRDVTGTVESIPLITASIMCKKMAETLDSLVLDVKFGSAAFMLTFERAHELAHSLVEIGRLAKLPTRALLTDMNQPLGRMVGNACEVNEAVEILRGDSESLQSPLAVVTLRLCSELLCARGAAGDLASADCKLQQELASGRPLDRFFEMVRWQGGAFFEQLPLARVFVVEAPVSGCIRQMHGRLLGQAVIELGGGRKRLGQAIDHSVGLEMLVRIGQGVSAREPLVRIFARDGAGLDAARSLVAKAIVIDDTAVPHPTAQHPLITPL